VLTATTQAQNLVLPQASHQNFVILMLTFLSAKYSVPGTFTSEESEENENKT
jgi:hypothetical protein